MRRVSAAAEQATAAQFSELPIAPKQLGAHLQRPLPARGLCAPLPCTAFSTLPCKTPPRGKLQLKSCAGCLGILHVSLDAAESLQPRHGVRALVCTTMQAASSVTCRSSLQKGKK